jgi:hypothetical protein
MLPRHAWQIVSRLPTVARLLADGAAQSVLARSRMRMPILFSFASLASFAVNSFAQKLSMTMRRVTARVWPKVGTYTE